MLSGSISVLSTVHTCSKVQFLYYFTQNGTKKVKERMCLPLTDVETKRRKYIHCVLSVRVQLPGKKFKSYLRLCVGIRVSLTCRAM